MGQDKKALVSGAVIRRLPRYYRFFESLLDNDITRISSKEISEAMGFTASQIRQDFNNFGSFGQQGYGYNVSLLYGETKRILGLDKVYNMILIGLGNYGQALVNYPNFKKRGYNFVAAFDNNPDIVGKIVAGLNVADVCTMEDFLAKNSVDIAVLTLPDHAVEETAQRLIDSGIKAIWNFSSVEIAKRSGTIVEDVRLTDSLMILSYKMKEEVILEEIPEGMPGELTEELSEELSEEIT